MTETLRPTTPEEVRDTVAWAVSEEAPLEVVGAGSKRAVGRAAQSEHTLDLSALSGIVLYEPEELVLSAYAGTPMAELEAALAARGQMFAFEPVDVGPLLGVADGAGTLGGAWATNLSGPRRIKAGAVRDHVLGLKAVSGRGEAFKSGGRVVKNVTGYDLARGLAGSWGTLAVATELAFKVLPRPETAATLVLAGLSDADAAKAMAAAVGSSADVSAAAHLPAAITASVPETAGLGASATLLRLEGFGPSVEARFAQLAALLAPFGAAHRIDAEASAGLWRAVRDVVPFAGERERAVWRISVAPTAGHSVVVEIARERSISAYYDWAGGLVWLATGEDGDAGVGLIRRAIAAAGGGHATLIRGSAELRARIAVFQPQEPSLAALSRRLKEQFDPRGILDPGRMAAGH